MESVLHMRRYITHTALHEVTTVVSRPRTVVSVGEVLAKEVCARICLKAVSECDSGDLGFHEGCVPENTKFSQMDSMLLYSQEEKIQRKPCLPTNHYQVIKSLLNSRDYEIRLITLEHLNTYLSRNYSMSRKVHMAGNHGNDEDKEILDGLIDGMKRVFLTDCHLEDIAIDILEMAMEKEQHLDCLGQVRMS